MSAHILRKLAMAGAFLLSGGFALQAVAGPIFTFSEKAGFENDVTIADYSNALPAGYPNPSSGPYYADMAWRTGASPQSSLHLVTYSGPVAPDTWVTLTTLTHNNVVIPFVGSWGPQDIVGRLIITDWDGTPTDVYDDQNLTTINFVESLNRPSVQACPGANPLGSRCDDWFTFTATALDSDTFLANDGSNWLAEFRLANFVNSAVVLSSVYTAERTSSSVDLQMRLTEVPEPAILGLLGLGLTALGFVRRRQMTGCAG